MFNTLIRPTMWLGELQAHLAGDFRDGGLVRKFCVLPTWAVTRLLFLGLLEACKVVQ